LGKNKHQWNIRFYRYEWVEWYRWNFRIKRDCWDFRFWRYEWYEWNPRSSRY
jgi:hypothetical protein